MKSPNEVKQEIMEELFDHIHDLERVARGEQVLFTTEQAIENLNKYVSQSLDRLQASIVESLPPLTKAHTYASENSEVCRAYDNGQKDYYQIEKLPPNPS